MKDIKYICNLCSDAFSQQQAHGMGLIFGCYFSNLKNFRLVKLPAETDRHICKNCVEHIKQSHLDADTKTN